MQLQTKQIWGILSAIGAGTGTMLANGLAHLATFVDVFGTIGVVSSGIIGAAGVMALGLKLYKKLDRIEVSSDFTAGNFMVEKPGNLLFEIKDGIAQAKKAAEDAKDQAKKAKDEAAGAHALNKKNSEILAAMRGHTHVQNENVQGIKKQLGEQLPEMIAKEDEALRKLDIITPPST